MSRGSAGRILIIKPGSLGDILHALPCAAAIKAAQPETQLEWLCDSRWLPLLEKNPVVDRVIAFPRQQFRGLAGAVRFARWAGQWRQQHHSPDITLDLQGLLRSGILSFLAAAPRTIGLSDSREGARFFHQHRVPVGVHEHAVRRYLRSLSALEIPQPDRPAFPLPEAVLPAIPLPAQFVVLHPFSRGAGKSLSSDAILALCDALAGVPVVLVGQGVVPGGLPKHVHNLVAGTSLLELLAVMRQATAVVSVDSGPMHIAAAVNPQVLGIHTWSDPRLVGPFSETAWIWQGGELRPQDLTPTAWVGEAQIPDTSSLRKIADWVRSRVPTV